MRSTYCGKSCCIHQCQTQSLNKFECTQACSLQFSIISLSSLNISLTFFQISFYPPVFPPFHPLLAPSPPTTLPSLKVFTFATQAIGQGVYTTCFLSEVPGEGRHFSQCSEAFPLASLDVFPTQHGTPWNTARSRNKVLAMHQHIHIIYMHQYLTSTREVLMSSSQLP